MTRGRVIAIIILLAAIIVFTACGKSESQESKAGAQSVSSTEESISTEQTDTTGGAITVLSKSDNAVKDVDKQKVIVDLNSEIDDLIDSINSLEDVQSSDLTFE